MSNVVKIIIYGISLSIIDGIMASLYSKRKKEKPKNQSATQYTIEAPEALAKVYIIGSCFFAFLFIFFLIFHLLGNESATIGHLLFFVIGSSLCAFVVIWAKSWIVSVNGNQIEFKTILHKKEVITFDEIEKVETDSKGAIGLFVNGKRRITVSALCENQDYLIQSLKAYGKWNENELKNTK